MQFTRFYAQNHRAFDSPCLVLVSTVFITKVLKNARLHRRYEGLNVGETLYDNLVEANPGHKIKHNLWASPNPKLQFPNLLEATLFDNICEESSMNNQYLYG